MFTALLVSGGGFWGLGVLKSLRRSREVRIVVADCYADCVTRYFADAFFQVPRVSDGEAFLSALREICAREEVRLVLPCSPFELPLLAGQREAFAASGVTVAVSSPAFVAVAGDKRRLQLLLAGQGLPILPEIDPRAGGPFPRIGKPLGGWGSRDLRIIHSPEEWERQRCRALVEDYLWQPYLEGYREFSVDFALAADGTSSSLGARERMRVSGGFALVSEAAHDPAVVSLAARVVEAIRPHGARGVFNLQLLAAAGQLYVSDLNLRLGTSAVHWCGEGPNPALFLCRALEASLDDEAVARPQRMVRYLDELWLHAPSRPAGIRGVVFDLDDTLVHQKLWMARKLELLLAELHRPLDSQAARVEALRLIEEGPRERLLDVLAARLGLEAGAVPRLIQRYRELVPEQSVAFPEVHESLARLRRAGLKLALLADNPAASQRQKLKACGLEAHFDATVFTEELGATKPALRGFESVAEQLALPASALVMVGDNPYRDGAGALAAGYGAAYLVERAGTFFNFEPRLYGEPGSRLRRIRDLRGLLAELID